MPNRLANGGVPYAVRAPLKYSNGELPIQIKEANAEVLNYWHKNVQLAFINKMVDTRADGGWNWPKIVRRNSIIANVRGQRPKCYSAGVVIKGRFIPLSLVFLAENYPALYDKSQNSSFIWFMASAPESFFTTVMSHPKIASFGKICIDIGVTSSINNLNRGVIGLHAAPEGGSKLIDYYESKCDLKSLDKNVSISLIRRNDGRYFYLDPNSAFNFSHNHDHLR